MTLTTYIFTDLEADNLNKLKTRKTVFYSSWQLKYLHIWFTCQNTKDLEDYSLCWNPPHDGSSNPRNSYSNTHGSSLILMIFSTILTKVSIIITIGCITLMTVTHFANYYFYLDSFDHDPVFFLLMMVFNGLIIKVYLALGCCSNEHDWYFLA